MCEWADVRAHYLITKTCAVERGISKTCDARRYKQITKPAKLVTQGVISN